MTKKNYKNIITSKQQHKAHRELINLNNKLLKYQEENKELKNFINNAHDLFQGVDFGGKIIYVNKAWLKKLNYTKSEIIGMNILKIIAPEYKKHCIAEFKNLINGIDINNTETVFLTKSSQRLIVEGSITILKKDGKPFATRGIFRDITQKKELEKNILHLATHDSLTNLSNRYDFIKNLKKSLEEAKKNKNEIAIFSFDLDRFKEINDELGHSAGDYVLKEISHRIKKCTRKNDIVSRFGGDEFAMIINPINNHNEVQKTISRLTKCVTKPILINKKTKTVGISIGYAIYPKDGSQYEKLLSIADKRMYKLKKQNRINKKENL